MFSPQSGLGSLPVDQLQQQAVSLSDRLLNGCRVERVVLHDVVQALRLPEVPVLAVALRLNQCSHASLRSLKGLSDMVVRGLSPLGSPDLPPDEANSLLKAILFALIFNISDVILIVE